MIAGINESKTLAKHISCECKCKFDSKKFNLNLGITITVSMSVKIQKSIACAKKIIFGILQHILVKKINI